MRFDDLIVWHPYPAEKPRTSGEYLITKNTQKGDYLHIVYGINYSVKHDRWNWFDGLDPKKDHDDTFTPYTTAWAEMPKVTPYAG